MSNLTGTFIWPAALAVAMGAIAAVATTVLLVNSIFAQSSPVGTDQPQPPAVMVSGWSSSPGGTGNIEFVINTDTDLYIDSSFVLVLDDKFQVLDYIPNGEVYVRQLVDAQGRLTPSDGVRVRATASVDSEDDSYVGDDSHIIRVYVPDMDPSDNTVAGIQAGTFHLVIRRGIIKNPTEAGTYKAGYQILDVIESYDDEATVALPDVEVYAKVSLSNESGQRGDELTITGAGFNGGSAAAAYVLKGQGDGAPDCETVVRDGDSLGSETVGRDHRVVITVEVTGGSKGDFSPGATNYICIRDNEAPRNRYSVSPEIFELRPSIRLDPSAARPGDSVSVYARDFPNTGAAFTELRVAGRTVAVSISDFHGAGGSATGTFIVPSGLEGTVLVEVRWGNASATARMNIVSPAQVPEVVPGVPACSHQHPGGQRS